MPVISRPGDGPQGGQSVVEFAILLPLLVALVGLAIDVARVYEAWTGLEAGTRDAAEYLARSSDDPLALDYGGSNTSAKAKYVLERETGVVFALDANQAACNSA